MKLGTIMGEHRALPEEMLTKKEVLFVQFLLWQKSRYSNLPNLSGTSTCEIPTLQYTGSLRKVPILGGPPYNSHFRENPLPQEYTV